MVDDCSESSVSRVEPVDADALTVRLRATVAGAAPGELVDDLEVRHLARVIADCSRRIDDVYSAPRLEAITNPTRLQLEIAVQQVLDAQRSERVPVVLRVPGLPEDARIVGDTALFDLGLRGRRSVRGYDLQWLGARAYRAAAELLEWLAEDRQIQQYFRENRLFLLPLEQEVVFLNQCSKRFSLYAEILKRTRRTSVTTIEAERSSSSTASATCLSTPERSAAPIPDAEKADAALPVHLVSTAALDEAQIGSSAGRDQALSTYERMLLFGALDLEKLEQALNRMVVDQQRAVSTLCDEFSLFATGTRDPRKPPAYFLVGPTGVGKNHLVETLRSLFEGLWDLTIPLLTIEGPSYTYPSDINELRGATRGFIRSDEEGLLTGFHEKSSRSPLSIILIDEVEKAHPQLLTFFLSILDRGKTTDNRGQMLDFSNCMVFFTSNLGYSDAQQYSAPIGYLDEEARRHTADAEVRRGLRRALRPEFMNRVRIVHFDRLTRSSAERILDLELRRISNRYLQWHDLRIELAPSAREELIRRGFSPEFGARHLSVILESVCNVEIAKRVRRDDASTGRDATPLVTWLREVRAGERAFEEGEVKRRVIDAARARLDYRALRVVYGEGGFDYVPLEPSE